MYVFTHFGEMMDFTFIMMPSRILLAKLTPPGVESSQMAFSATILMFNLFLVRNLVGVFINREFIGVEKENID